MHSFNGENGGDWRWLVNNEVLEVASGLSESAPTIIWDSLAWEGYKPPSPLQALTGVFLKTLFVWAV